MTDIPLTREQRQLLGLTPQNVPLPAGSPGYVTPPRYSRSSTPRSSAQRHTSASPMSHKASPSSFEQSALGVSRGPSGSPFAVSPLMQKAVGGASAARTSSPLDNSLGSSSSGLATGKATVSLNSKWLYERGKGSPTGARAVFS
jgi:nucleoporin POM34